MAVEEKCIRTFDRTSFVRNKKADAARKEAARVLKMQAEMKKDEAVEVLDFEVARVPI